MTRTLIKLIKPLRGPARFLLGPNNFRLLRERLIQNLRFDEVSVVCRAIGEARRGTGVMLDVGCHRGESAEPFAELGWSVHCFEPNPSNWPVIQRRVIDRYPKTYLYRHAVGENIEEARTFFTSKESTGISSLHAFHKTHTAAFSVDVSTIAEHCRKQVVEYVDFLKIDTEGFDLFVLKGVDWATCAPDVIVCEFEDRKTTALGYSFYDMANYLRDIGYRVIVSEWKPIVHYGGGHKWERYCDFPCDLKDPNAWGNIIAVRQRDAEIAILRELRTIAPFSR